MRRLVAALGGLLLLLAACSSDNPKPAATSAADAQSAWHDYLSALKAHDLAAARKLTCRTFLDAGNDPSTFADQIAPPSGGGVTVTGGSMSVAAGTARARLTFVASNSAAHQTVVGTTVWQVQHGHWQVCDFTR